MSDLVERARIFALDKHKGQTRFGIHKLPLSQHLEEVVALVKESGGSDNEIAAAWLHDVIEDTPVLFSDISRNFGAEVAAIVFGLTDPPEFKTLHTRERKTAQAERIRSFDSSIKRVKIADQTSNVRSLVTEPPVLWSAQKCLDYIEGARRVVFECREASEFLFAKFGEAYWSAIRAYLQ